MPSWPKHFPNKIRHRNSVRHWGSHRYSACPRDTMDEIMPVLADVLAEMESITNRGKLADYIPELSKCDPTSFAMAVASYNGTT